MSFVFSSFSFLLWETRHNLSADFITAWGGGSWIFFQVSFLFLLYPKQRLGSSQWCGNDRILVTGWKAKELESFINDKSQPSGKGWKGVQFDLASEEGVPSATGQAGSCLWLVCFLRSGACPQEVSLHNWNNSIWDAQPPLVGKMLGCATQMLCVC